MLIVQNNLVTSGLISIIIHFLRSLFPSTEDVQATFLLAYKDPCSDSFMLIVAEVETALLTISAKISLLLEYQ